MPRPPARRAEAIPPPPSKTRRKQAMHDLQALGEALVELDPAAVAKLGLPETLADAVALARGITRHEARRRQMQYLGRLMRDVDPEPIRAAIERVEGVDQTQKAQFAAAEVWRERLMADDDAVAAFATEHPGVAAADLAALVSDARVERSSGRPPHRFRALFRLIAKSLQPGPPSPVNE